MKKSVKRKKSRSVKPRKSRSVKRRSRSVKPRRSRRSVKPRKSIKKKKKEIDTGDFSDTDRYNINAKVITDLDKNKLKDKYNELIKYLELRKRQLKLAGESTFKVDIQIKSAQQEKTFLEKCIEENEPWKKALILLNSMP